LGWLGVAAVIIAVAATKLSYRIQAWWARDRIAEVMDRHPAGQDADPIAVADAFWWHHVDEAAEAQAWETTRPLYSNETAQKVAAILAHNEAERAWRDEDAVRRFMEGSR
jgi:hypothetical protein